MKAWFKTFLRSVALPAVPAPRPTYPPTDEYLDLMLEWGTIADIPNLVRIIRNQKNELAALGSKNE